MSNLDVIRAWKDEEYRNRLSEEEKALLPANPAGLVELSDADLSDVNGGTDTGVGCVLSVASLVTAVTAIASCGFCDKTAFSGTCKLYTKGCCPR
jgi:mersacidin/lichenicidin family type 2 lantibiotic